MRDGTFVKAGWIGGVGGMIISITETAHQDVDASTNLLSFHFLAQLHAKSYIYLHQKLRMTCLLVSKLQGSHLLYMRLAANDADPITVSATSMVSPLYESRVWACEALAVLEPVEAVPVLLLLVEPVAAAAVAGREESFASVYTHIWSAVSVGTRLGFLNGFESVNALPVCPKTEICSSIGERD